MRERDLYSCLLDTNKSQSRIAKSAFLRPNQMERKNLEKKLIFLYLKTKFRIWTLAVLLYWKINNEGRGKGEEQNRKNMGSQPMKSTVEKSP